MHQYMPHTFNDIPINFGMSCSKLRSEHINSLANNLNVLYKSKEYDWIIFNIRKIIFVFVAQKHINGIQNMFEPSFVLNRFSHI